MTRAIELSQLGSNITVDDSGRVGIGTATPRQTFHVNGDLQIGSTGGLIANASNVVNGVATSIIGTNGNNIDHLWHDDSAIYGTGGSWNFCSDASYRTTGNSNINVGHIRADNGTLGTTAGDVKDLGKFFSDTGNGISLNFRANREITGTAWTSTSMELYCLTDVTEQGYIKFNPRGTTVGDGNYDVAIGSTAGEIIRFEDGGNVGIGVTNPSGKLHISSGTAGDCRVYIEADTDNNNEGDNPYIVFINDGGSEQASVWCGNADGTNDNSLNLSSSVSVGGGIRFFTGNTDGDWETASERMRIDSLGNVGIGTIDPQKLLHVEGTGVVAQFGNSSTTPYDIIEIDFSNTGYPSIAVPSSSDTLQLKTLGSVKIAIDSNNNSSESFEIVHGGHSAGGNQLMYLDENGNFRINQAVSSWTNSTTHPILRWDFKSGVGDMMYMASGGNTSIANQMALVISDGQGFKVGRSGWDGADADVSSSNEYFRITTTGNVGIGTQTPTAKLDVEGDGGIFVKTSNNNPSDGAWIRFSDHQAGTPQWAQYGWIKYKHGDGQIAPGSNDGFFIGGSEANTIVRVQGEFISDGNVGIGTDDPNQKLEILNGAIRASSSSATQGTTIIEGRYSHPNVLNILGSLYSSGSTYLSYGLRASTTTEGYVSSFSNFSGGRSALEIRATGLRFRTASAQNTAIGTAVSTDIKFLVENNGNVGIGTDSASSTLHIVSAEIGTGSNRGLRIDNYNSTKSYSIRTGISGSQNTSLAIYDETSGNNRLVISTGGNVGIGVASPGEKLHVAGNIDLNGSVIGGKLTSLVGDNTIATVTPPTRGGILAITSFTSVYDYPQPTGTTIVYYDVGPSRAIQFIASASGASVQLSTSTSTTATDYTDGYLTIVAGATDTIRLVNRLAAGYYFKLTWL